MVFPVPGPPVIMRTLLAAACRIAERCAGASVMRPASSKRATASSTPVRGGGAGTASRFRSAVAVPRSATWSDFR